MKFTLKGKMLALILAIAFVMYNAVLFIICGFKDHGTAFWVSWVFMIIAFAAMAFAGVLLGKRGMFLRDWLFGYPIIKHTATYIIVEFILSTLFIVFDKHISWPWVFASQFIVLCIYLVFAISCMLAKETIDEIHTRTSDKTAFIRLLTVDAEMLCEKCQDGEAKKQFANFTEQVRMSDPMSSETLFELEKEIMLIVSEMNAQLTAGDVSGAVEKCKQAALLLTERNKKVKALK